VSGVTAAGPSEEAPHEDELADRHAGELRDARRRVIDAGDVARQRLGRDLHDGAQQQLITAVINLQRAQRLWSSDPARAKALLDAGVDRAESGLQALRELATGLHPPILTHLGLTAAVEALTARMPPPVTLDLPAERLPAALEASVYFLVAEALTNVVKHARASNAAVRIVVEEDRVLVAASDDGVGGAEPSAGGSGLWGMADRVEALNGTFSIASSGPDGTTVRADIPIAVPPKPV
jgi:signal transduction histidine kinase